MLQGWADERNPHKPHVRGRRGQGYPPIGDRRIRKSGGQMVRIIRLKPWLPTLGRFQQTSYGRDALRYHRRTREFSGPSGERKQKL